MSSVSSRPRCSATLGSIWEMAFRAASAFSFSCFANSLPPFWSNRFCACDCISRRSCAVFFSRSCSLAWSSRSWSAASRNARASCAYWPDCCCPAFCCRSFSSRSSCCDSLSSCRRASSIFPFCSFFWMSESWPSRSCSFCMASAASRFRCSSWIPLASSDIRDMRSWIRSRSRSTSESSSRFVSSSCALRSFSARRASSRREEASSLPSSCIASRRARSSRSSR